MTPLSSKKSNLGVTLFKKRTFSLQNLEQQAQKSRFWTEEVLKTISLSLFCSWMSQQAMQKKTLWTQRDWVEWQKPTSARSVWGGLGHKSDAVPVEKHLQAPTPNNTRGAAEQVIPRVLPWGPQGWEMKLLQHLSVCRHSSEHIKCVCQSWRACGAQVFAPDKKPEQVLWECGSLKRRSQDSFSFPVRFIALKTRIWTVFSTEDQVPPS